MACLGRARLCRAHYQNSIHAPAAASSKRSGERVGVMGLRPPPLPHHRTCGFPHPAVELSGGLPSPVRSQSMPDTRVGWATSSLGPRLVSPEWRPQLSRSAVSSVRSRPGQSLVWLRRVLRPFALPGFRQVSSLLRPLLTSPGLSAGGSPRVNVCSFRSRHWALQPAVNDFSGFVFPSTLAPDSLPLCPFVFLWSNVCLPPFRIASSRRRPGGSATVGLISPRREPFIPPDQIPAGHTSGRGSGIAPATPPTPPDVRFSASGG